MTEQARRIRNWGSGLVLALLLAAQGCATVPVNGFQRARTLQQGHAELGGALSLGRLPLDGAMVAASDRGQEGEPAFGSPTPSLHFRMGIDERLDAGVAVWPGGLKLTGKYGILDSDELMLAGVLDLGWWSSGNEDSREDALEASSPLMLGFRVPVATRPLPWLELNAAPVLEIMQVWAQREAYQAVQERSYMTVHTGFSVGANFAVWRVRIQPEVSVLGSYRSDREEGFWGLYPGIGAFVVY